MNRVTDRALSRTHRRLAPADSRVSSSRARGMLLVLAAFAGIAASIVHRPEIALADYCASVPPVFDGDPCDPATGPYPMLPDLPLVLPAKGPTGRWSDGPYEVTPDFTGDVDLAVRVGTFPTETEIPAPAGSAGNPTLTQIVAGGGGSGQGSSAAFTVFVTDGPGSTTYGSPIAGLDERPLAVYGYADLDGDGVIGPSNTDGLADNELEKQEAIGHVGRQVGQIAIDRFSNSLAVRIGAPASIGGLRIALAAGMYTGDDPGLLWSNGTPIFTKWPFFPPLDPLQIVYLTEANPPDPNGPNILFYQSSEFLLPDPEADQLNHKFVVPTDGSSATTDQFISISGPAVGARLFRDVDPDTFTPASRLGVRPAPAMTGTGRKLVTPAGEIAIKSGRDVRVRLMPVDSLGNIADPGVGGVPTKLLAEGGLRIDSPNEDGDPYGETLTVTSARGIMVRLGTVGVEGRTRLTLYDPPPAQPVGLDQALIFASASGDVDADDDGVPDDGNGNGTIGDRPCSPADLANVVDCDDNCPNVVNPSQSDSDGDGQGNCCDGTCVINDDDAGCIECPEAASRFRSLSSRAKTAIRPRVGTPDRVGIRTILRLEEGQDIAPDAEQVEVTVAEGDRLHYFVQLPGVFTLVDDRPTYYYDDPDASVGGIYRARLRQTSRGFRAKFLARQVDLVDTEPAEELSSGLVLAITIGDDTFTRHMKCTSSLSVVRCVSTDVSVTVPAP